MFALFPLELAARNLPRTVPWANLLLVALNVFFYLLMVGTGYFWTCGQGSSFLSIFLYGFSHAGFWHLAANLWVLIVFGNAVNRRIGNGFYLIAYLSSVAAIGLAAWLLFPGRVVGASGGVFAVIGISLLLLPAARLRVGYIALFPITVLVASFRRPEHPWEWAIRWGDFKLGMIGCLVFIPLLELWGLFWSGGNWTHLGHLLGLIAGVIVVLLLSERLTLHYRLAKT